MRHCFFDRLHSPLPSLITRMSTSGVGVVKSRIDRRFIVLALSRRLVFHPVRPQRPWAYLLIPTNVLAVEDRGVDCDGLDALLDSASENSEIRLEKRLILLRDIWLTVCYP